MLPICVRPERVWPKLSSIQGIRANLVYIVSLRIKCIFTHFLLTLNFIYYRQFCCIPIEIYTKKEPLITDADVFLSIINVSACTYTAVGNQTKFRRLIMTLRE